MQTHCHKIVYRQDLAFRNWITPAKALKKKKIKITWAVCPCFILNLERFTPLKLILLTNNFPCSSSPHAPIIPQETPKPALSPLIVFATLPPAIVFIGDSSSGEASLCAFTSFNICSSSSIATYITQNTLLNPLSSHDQQQHHCPFFTNIAIVNVIKQRFYFK